MGYRLTRTARRQIREILAYSLREHGRAAADRYDLLMTAAFAETGSHPLHLLSRPVPGAASVREYDLRHSRTSLAPQQRVANPRHKIVYALSTNGDVDVLAVIGHSLPSALGPER